MNEEWGRKIIGELIHLGVRTFCIAPGSRNTPLTLAAASHPLAETIVHYDERGLGYFALGVAKGNKRPVALIVTSGTAAGNLLPAVMEAHHDHLPLVVLTADRPPELIGSNANQTTNQKELYHNFVRWEGEIPLPSKTLPIEKTIEWAVGRAMGTPQGPIHLNCPFRKPLHDKGGSSFQRKERTFETTLFQGKGVLEERELEEISRELLEYEKGVILVSHTNSIEDNEALHILSRTLQWPIFPDILSDVRTKGWGYGATPYYDLILKALGTHEDYGVDAILSFGDRFVSKKLLDWISFCKPKAHIQIAPYPPKKDGEGTVTHQITADPNLFLTSIENYLSSRPPSKWFETWKTFNRNARDGIEAYFENRKELSEGALFHHLSKNLSPHTSLFIGNSMPIRNGDAFFAPEEPSAITFGNRGLSGIDGNIATLAGIATSSKKPLVGVIGDLTFLHDLNSLPLIKNLPVKLIVINNNGGDIFSFLPIREREEVFEKYFTNPHNLPLEKVAPLFDIPYSNPETLDELDRLLSQKGAMLIEMNTVQGENLEIHGEIALLLNFCFFKANRMMRLHCLKLNTFEVLEVFEAWEFLYLQV